MTRTRLLQHNPEPIKIIPAGTGLRGAFEAKPHKWRCDHEDGRGRCTSRETKALLLSRSPIVVGYYCKQHFARHDVLVDRDSHSYPRPS